MRTANGNPTLPADGSTSLGKGVVTTVAVAVANKNARVIWALLQHGGETEPIPESRHANCRLKVEME